MTKNKAGVSLIESLIVIAILAILASVAVPYFQNAVNSNRLKSAAESVYSQIQFARSESIKQDRNLFVTIQGSGTTAWCIGISNTTDCNCSTANSCVFGPTGSQIERNIRGSDFTAITVATTKAEIEFDSRRGAANGGGSTITITGSSGLNTSVITSTLGRVRICGGNVGGYPSC